MEEKAKNIEDQKLEMQKLCVVPDVLNSIPPEILVVSYTDKSSKECKTVEMGNILTPTDVVDPPTVKWNANPKKFYLLCLTDPDAPSRDDPKFREWQHWLVGNIPGSDIEKGDTITEYVGSAPPKGTGLHRYVFVVYEQNGKIEFTEKKLSRNSPMYRELFCIKKFAEKYNLGKPVAGNFYQAEYDDIVPTIFERVRCC